MDFDKAFDKAAAMCARNEKCSGDIRRKLSNWEVDEETVDKVISKLEQEKYIDDNRFSGFFVRDKFRFNHWGKTKIRFHLKQKGVADENIANALTSIPDEEYENMVLEVLSAKSRSLSHSDLMKRKASLLRHAASKGFEYDVIMKNLERFL